MSQTVMPRTLRHIFYSSLIFLTPAPSYALETYNKLWTSAVITGSVIKDSSIKYYIEPDLRLIDDPYIFSQAIFWLGLGYQVSPGLLLYAGDSASTTRRTTGKYQHNNSPWQQASFILMDSDEGRLQNRVRLLEQRNTDSAQWSFILRDMLQIKVPIQAWPKHSVVLSDEVFFRFKHPAWTNTTKFLFQNRIMLGLETRISKTTAFTLGYLNQTRYGTNNQLNNVLVMSVEINTG